MKEIECVDNLNLVELTKEELIKIDGGDGMTKKLFMAIGYFVQSVSDGYSTARRNSPGAYIPNM